MAAFDLNNLYFIKGNAPKTTSFDDLMGSMKSGFNLGQSAKAQYDKNSLQNLIAQRETEGVPYYKLGNEAAKWDLDAAQSMDKDWMSRAKYDHEMKKDAFETWRKAMARRICGRILQIAEQMGMQEQDLAGVLYTAYTYVVTYDPDLASQLLAQYKSLSAAKAKANKPTKPSNDDRVAMMKEKEKFLQFSKNTEATQKQRDIAAAEYSRYNMIEKYLGGRYPMYSWMPGFLRGFVADGGSSIDGIKAIIAAYNPEYPSPYEYKDLLGFNEVKDDSGLEELEGLGDNDGNGKKEPKTPKKSANTEKGAVTKNTGKQSDGTYSFVKKGVNSLGDYIYPIENAQQVMGNAINEAESEKDLNNIIAGMENYESISGAKDVTNLKKLAEEKRKEIKSIEEEAGKSPIAKLFWQNLPARSRMADARRFRQAGTFAAGIVSNTPLSIIDNGLMVQSPDYQVTKGMQDNSTMLYTEDGWKMLKSALTESKNPYVRKFAKQNTAYDVVASIGRDVVNTIKPMYNEIMSACKSSEEKEQVRSFLRSSYSWPQTLIDAMETENGSLGSAEELAKRAKKYEKKARVEFYEDGVKLEDGRFVSREDWNNMKDSTAVKSNANISTVEDIE